MTVEMDVTFRPAAPGDAEVIAPLVYSSGPAAFDYVFTHRVPVTAREFLYRALKTPGGEFGYECHVVGELDGTVVAVGASYSGESQLAHTIAAFRQIISCYGPIKGAGVIRRGLRVESVVQPPKGPVHYVAHLGVHPDFRSRGIGEQLVNYLLEEGRTKGRTIAALDVSVENSRAEALYARMGFEVTRECPSVLRNETAQVPDHRRMEKPLN